MFRIPFALLFFAASACSGFRSVGDGADGVYRAPQMHEDLLARTVTEHGIRSIVCLRGSGQSRGPSERAAIGTDVAFWNVPMSATRLPSPATLLALWEVAQNAERPLILHCRAGVDRTGLASAIVVLHDTGDLDAADEQLDLVPYGHVAWTQTGAMDEVLERYAPHHTRGVPFPEWVSEVYAEEFDDR